MGTVKPKMLTVGKVVNTHGIRGELKVWPETDFPGERFRPGAELWLVAPDESQAIPHVVAGARPQKNLFLVKFREYDNINQVERFKGWKLKVPAENRVKLAPNEYYFHDIIGCSVVSESGENIGVVTEILRPGANDVWVVRRPGGKLAYLPYIADVVLNVDVEGRRVTISVLEGLLE